jgi:hypothetical protein
MSPNTASLAPQFEATVHIVVDDFGEGGLIYRETDEQSASFEGVVDDLVTGQFNNPVEVMAFNIAEGRSRDVSEDVAREVLKRAAKEDKRLGASRRFVQFHLGEEELLRAGIAD